jgi:hypothetical protein
MRRLERHGLLLGERVMKLRVERRAQQLRELEPEVAIDQRLALASQDGLRRAVDVNHSLLAVQRDDSVGDAVEGPCETALSEFPSNRRP